MNDICILGASLIIEKRGGNLGAPAGPWRSARQHRSRVSSYDPSTRELKFLDGEGGAGACGSTPIRPNHGGHILQILRRRQLYNDVQFISCEPSLGAALREQ